MNTGKLDENLKFVFSNGIIVFLLTILSSGLGFVFQIILGRYLGVESYGGYTVFITYINFMCIFTIIGIDNSLIRTIARIDEKYKKSLLIKSLKMGCTYFFIFSLITYFLGTYIIDNNISNSKLFYVLLYFTVFIKTISQIFDGYYQGEKKTVLVKTILVFLSIFKLVFFILIFIILRSVYAAIISYVISEVLCMIIKIVYYKVLENKSKYRYYIRYPKNEFSDFLKYSFSLSLITGTSILMQNIDKIMINFISGVYEVGLYRSAENYSTLIAIFASTFVVFWPVMSSLYSQKKIYLLNNIFSYITKFLCLLSIPTIVLVIVYSKELLLIFGNQYISSSSILIVLLLGIIIDTLSGPVGALLNMTEYAKYNLINMILLATLNIILNIILIPKFGAIGAAFATSVSCIIINFINIIQNKILLGIFPYDKKNIILILNGVIIWGIDIFLYKNIFYSKNILEIILTGIINYIVYTIIFILIVKPNLDELKFIMKNKNI